MRKSLPFATTSIAAAALSAAAALCRASTAIADTPAAPAPPSALPQVAPLHAVGEVFNYTVSGTMSQAIDGKDPFGAAVRQAATPTNLQGRERVAVKAVSARGLSLHRTGTIVATFRGRSSPAQHGSGWTLVTPDGAVSDRKGSTLGGLFLLPLGFLGERSVDGGATLQIGDRWTGKLGMALFGMTARPRLTFQVVGTRQVFGVTVYSLTASGSAPVREPVVTNDDIALGNAVGIARVTLHCDYDAARRRIVSMAIDVTGNLHVSKAGRSAGSSVHDREHYLVALDATSVEMTDPATSAPRD